jgi:hypothetical protein
MTAKGVDLATLALQQQKQSQTTNAIDSTRSPRASGYTTRKGEWDDRTR